MSVLGSGSGQRRRPFRKLAVAQAAPARPVMDDVRRGLALRGGNSPVLRGCAHQHAPRGRADLPHRLEEVADVCGSVGILVAVAFVARRLDHAHAIEVSVHLVGDDHRQRGPHPLSHLGAVRHDLDAAFRVERQEQVEPERPRVGGRAPHRLGAQAKNERTGAETGQLEEFAPPHECDMRLTVPPCGSPRGCAGRCRSGRGCRSSRRRSRRRWAAALRASSAAAVMIWPAWQ